MISEAKKSFLSQNLSNGKYKYKRYRGSPIRYAGGKSLGVCHVVEYLPVSVSRVVSPFIGGGSVEVAMANDLGMQVRGYDIFDVLAEYWKQQLARPAALALRIKQFSPAPEVYKLVKERLSQHWKKEKLIDNKLDLAAHYWFNHNLSYGPAFLGWMSKIYCDQNRFERAVDRVKNFSASNLQVEAASFEHVIPAHKGSFFYCDPPYFLDGTSKMFKGIYPQRNFPVHHNNFQHTLLRDMLAEYANGFILSYNDCQEVRDLYKNYKIVTVKWQYTLGQGETRIGKNREHIKTDPHIKKSHELLIIGDRR